MLADFVEMFLQRQLAEACKRQIDKDRDLLKQHAIGVVESERLLSVGSFDRRRIREAPMGRLWAGRA